ncbi:MAG TPA: DUF3179 domain-containing (seleno)protein [Chryseolinea sp.]|nr:DUF3179 domain-containing (seleno)protein [Chryseolinea sp.]
MKKIFYIGVAGLALFEILKVYFIMPMPGSQRMDSLDIAYFLHSYRWFFRIAFLAMILVGSIRAFSIKHKWIPALLLAGALYVVYLFNFEMLADEMFKQPEELSFKNKTENLLTDSSVVIGVEHNGEAKAYPVRYILYHHQVQDTIGGKPMIVTYCNVCRTGRVFEPTVKNQHEKFRLVGMDHFNAMFEDATTGSWWRQVTGEAVAGPLKGQLLPEVQSSQVTLKKWFELYPEAVVMQIDEASRTYYDSTGRFEKGKSKGKLTRMDSLSWKDKSWVVGVQVNAESKAYDWIELKQKRIVNDVVGGQPIVIAVAEDNQSFAAFERFNATDTFTFRNDTLCLKEKRYNFSGRDLTTLSDRLRMVKAYQEFWHSWRTFHPNTKQYPEL